MFPITIQIPIMSVNQHVRTSRSTSTSYWAKRLTLHWTYEPLLSRLSISLDLTTHITATKTLTPLDQFLTLCTLKSSPLFLMVTCPNSCLHASVTSFSFHCPFLYFTRYKIFLQDINYKNDFTWLMRCKALLKL